MRKRQTGKRKAISKNSFLKSTSVSERPTKQLDILGYYFDGKQQYTIWEKRR